MSTDLVLVVEAAGVCARLGAGAQASAAVHGRREEGRLRVPADELWSATLAATRSALAPGTATPDRVRVAAEGESVAIWDTETLGAPGPVVVAPPGARSMLEGTLAAVRTTQPYLWDLLEEGRYAVGPVESYLVARMTRGTWQVTAPRWRASAARSGVPEAALPEVLTDWAGVRTDPGAFLGLDLALIG